MAGRQLIEPPHTLMEALLFPLLLQSRPQLIWILGLWVLLLCLHIKIISMREVRQAGRPHEEVDAQVPDSNRASFSCGAFLSFMVISSALRYIIPDFFRLLSTIHTLVYTWISLSFQTNLFWKNELKNLISTIFSARFPIWGGSSLFAVTVCPENPNHNMIRWDHISGTRGRGKKRKWLHPFVFLPLSSGASA